MKRVAKIMTIALVMSFIIISCKKDDDGPIMPSAKLNSVKYAKNKLDGKQLVAFNSENAIVIPKNASVTYKISKVAKDKKNFTNPKSGGFTIDSKGKISAAKDHKLEAGSYVLTVSATTKTNKKDKKSKDITKTATFTVVITASGTSKLISISYTPNELAGKQKSTFSSKKPTLNPKNASATYEISKITRDKKDFENPKTGGFKISANGKISLSEDHKLNTGTYVLNISASDKNDKKNIQTTKITIVVSEAALRSIAFTPNRLEVKQKVAFMSKSAVVKPNDVSVTFEISEIKKNKKSFANPEAGGFEIDSEGKISAPKDHKLAAGTYTLIIIATNKKDSKNKRKTTFGVVVK